MRIEIDASKCVTAGQCVLSAPTVFDQDDDGLVVLLDEHPDEGRRTQVMDAAALCPAAAIRVVDA